MLPDMNFINLEKLEIINKEENKKINHIKYELINFFEIL